MQQQRRAVKIGGDARLTFKKAVIKTECLVALHQRLARFECGFQELVQIWVFDVPVMRPSGYLCDCIIVPGLLQNDPAQQPPL